MVPLPDEAQVLEQDAVQVPNEAPQVAEPGVVQVEAWYEVQLQGVAAAV